MKNATIIIAPEVDAAILRLIDYVDPSEIPAVLNFLEAIQERMVRTLTDAPEGGPRFKAITPFGTSLFPNMRTGKTRNWQPAGPVWLNRVTENSAPEIRDAA